MKKFSENLASVIVDLALDGSPAWEVWVFWENSGGIIPGEVARLADSGRVGSFEAEGLRLGGRYVWPVAGVKKARLEAMLKKEVREVVIDN